MATPPTVANASPQSSVPSRSSSRAICPGTTGRGDDQQRTDVVARLEGGGRAGPGALEAAAELGLGLVGIDRVIAGEQAGIAGRDQDLDVGQGRRERVERADVVVVGVGQHDPLDRAVERGRCRLQLAGAAAQHRVDEGQAVVLGDQVGVDEPEPGHADGAGRGRVGGVLAIAHSLKTNAIS